MIIFLFLLTIELLCAWLSCVYYLYIVLCAKFMYHPC